MNVVVEETGPCRRKLSLTIPAEKIDAEYDEALNGFKTMAEMPGFRKGRAPLHLVKAKFNKGILEHLRDNLLPKAYNEAIEENSLDVVRIIEMDEDISVNVGEDLSFDVTVDVAPAFELPAYEAISLTREAKEISDADIDEAVEELRGRKATFEDVIDAPVGEGDIVQIDFVGRLDGTPLKEIDEAMGGIGEGIDFWAQANEESFIPEIGAALPGLNVGDTTEISAEFADSFAVEGVAGKTVAYTVTVKAIRGKVLPELDEAFLKDAEVETVDALREQTKERLEADAKRQDDGRLHGEIEKFLLENTTLDLPESVLAQEAAQQVQRIVNDASRQGMTDENFAEQREDIMGHANQAAERSVRLRYILARVGKEQDISVSEAEVKQEMAMMAYMYGMTPADLEKRIEENGSADDFRADVSMRKTMTWLFENAAITG